jgi:hypothetical protein
MRIGPFGSCDAILNLDWFLNYHEKHQKWKERMIVAIIEALSAFRQPQQFYYPTNRAIISS